MQTGYRRACRRLNAYAPSVSWMARMRPAGERGLRSRSRQPAADQPRRARARAGVARPLRTALAGVAAPQATTLIGWFTDLPAA